MAGEHTTEERERYSVGYGARAHQSMVQRTGMGEASFFLRHLRPGMRLLDVGAGPGSITSDLAEVVAPGEVIGIDLEQLQVERARALAAERGVANVRFEVGDAYALPFMDGSFDAVFAHMVLMHLRDPLAALKEFRRVLRSKGVVGIRDGVLAAAVHEPATPLLQEGRALIQRVYEHNRGRPSSVLDFRQRQLLLDAGFARTEGYTIVESAGTPETVRTHGMRTARVLDQAHRHTILAQGWADAAKVDAMVAELRAWAERPDSFGCLLACEAVGWVDAAEPEAGS
jgi:ubiquinone/menaquinone biosynthesis C-methylase UbiE